MIEIIQYITSDFWIFIGVAILISIVIWGTWHGIARVIRAVKWDGKTFPKPKKDDEDTGGW